jgi:hypothetical protein
VVVDVDGVVVGDVFVAGDVRRDRKVVIGAVDVGVRRPLRRFQRLFDAVAVADHVDDADHDHDHDPAAQAGWSAFISGAPW